MSDVIEKIVLNEKQLAKIVQQLANKITQDYYGKNNIVLVCILKGSFVFFADLVRQIKLEKFQIEFLKAKSYNGIETTNNVLLQSINTFPIEGKNILVVEDIIDTGHTLKKLEQYFLDNQAKSFEICVLLDKPERRKEKINPKYVGYQIKDKFVVGYGIDYDEKFRNLPIICYMKRS